MYTWDSGVGVHVSQQVCGGQTTVPLPPGLLFTAAYVRLAGPPACKDSPLLPPTCRRSTEVTGIRYHVPPPVGSTLGPSCLQAKPFNPLSHLPSPALPLGSCRTVGFLTAYLWMKPLEQHWISTGQLFGLSWPRLGVVGLIKYFNLVFEPHTYSWALFNSNPLHPNWLFIAFSTESSSSCTNSFREYPSAFPHVNLLPAHFYHGYFN